MELDIDQGNSRLKWRFSRQPMRCGTVEDLLQEVHTAKLTRVRIVSVVNNTRQQQLINMIILACKFPINWAIAKSTATCQGVTNGYNDPLQLGADRWCAIVAAACELQPHSKGLVVVGCGTAWTVDFIDSNKQHLGGWIAPGLVALRHGLRQCTQLTFDDLPAEANKNQQRGTNTQECINLGCTMMVEGFVGRIISEANARFAKNWLLAVHGGDAQVCMTYLPDYMEYLSVIELVLDGLAYVCEHAQPTSHPLT